MSTENRYAIVGVACRLPGHSNSPVEFFHNLRSRRDCITVIPPERFGAGYYNRLHEAHPARVVSHRGGLMDHFFDFDNKTFQISKKEALVQDPQQRILLETSLEALEDSNVAYRGSNMGVFVGSCATGVVKHNIEFPHHVNEYTATGTALSIHANLLSYKFDLRGPSTHVDTACSASGYAMFSAISSMDTGHCDSALVAGVNIMLDHCMMIAFGRLGILNADGKCKSFDASADGFVRSEGCGVVVVKPLESALRDGDKIYCVVRSCTANADGGLSQSLTTPSAEAQSLSLRRALDRANVDPSDVFFLEAHATGTKVGDPIELNGSGSVLGVCRDSAGESMLRIGSVKSNIGHTECSAYISSLIKCCLMLRYGCLVPNINYQQPNPGIKFDEYNMKIQLEIEEFDPEGKIVVVSSFGFGGANTCTVLEGVGKRVDRVMTRYLGALESESMESASDADIEEMEEEGEVEEEEEEGEGEEEEFAILEVTAVDPKSMVLKPPYCFFVYARTKDGLARRLEQYRKYSSRFVGDDSDAQARLALTLNTARQTHYSFMSWVFGESFHHNLSRVSEPIRLDDIRDAAPVNRLGMPEIQLPPGHSQHVVMVFSGQGPQGLNMGRGLYKRFRVFRETIDMCDAAYEKLSGVSLINDLGLFKGSEAKIAKETLDRIENTLPSLVFVQLALTELWRSVGVVPSAVMGHSFGELAASYACGATGSIETVLRIAYSRVKIVSQMKAIGKMLAVGSSSGEVMEMIREMGYEGKAWIAANNSPTSVTLGGEPEAIVALDQECRQRQLFSRILNIGNAFHTPLIRDVVDVALQLFGETVSNVGAPDPKIPLISTTYGGKLWRSRLTVDYFWDNIQNCVCFVESLDTADSIFGDDVIFLELAPHPILSYYMRQCGKKNLLCSLNRRFPEQEIFMQNLASLASLVGPLTINWRNVLLQGEGRENVEFHRFWDLPSYPFERQRLFFENEFYRRSRVVDDRARMPPMIGRLQHSVEETWLSHVSLRTHPWIKGHVVQSAVVMPAACYVEMLLECLYGEIPDEGCVLEEIDFVTSMTVPDAEFRYALLQTKKSGNEAFVHSKGDGPNDKWILQSHAKKGKMPLSGWYGSVETPEELRARLTHRHFDRKGVYDRLAESRLFYGPEFALVEELWQGDEEAYMLVNTENGVDLAGFIIHPTFLDVSFHGAIGTIRTVFETFIPDSVRRLVLRAPTEAFRPHVHIYTKLLEKDDKHFRGSVVVFDDSGRVLLEVEDLVCTILAELPRLPKVHVVPRFQTHALPIFDIYAPSWKSVPEWLEVQKMIRHVNHYIINTIREGLDRLAPFLDELSPSRRRYVQLSRKIIRLHQPVSCPVSLKSLKGFELEAELIKRVQDHWVNLQLNRNNEVRSVMFKDDLLERFYAQALTTRPTLSLFAQVLHRTVGDLVRSEHPARRVVRILELGSGTGAIARTVFPLLKEFSGAVEYYYTDISSGFFTDSLKKQFREFPFVRFIPIDASKPLGPQGIRDASIDIAIAYDCLHAIAHLENAIRNCQHALVPNGLLMLVEITSVPVFYNFVFGVFDGWLHFQDQRTHCCLSRQDWRKLLDLYKLRLETCVGDRRDVHSIMVARKMGFLGDDRPLLAKDTLVFRGNTNGYELIEEIQKVDAEWKGDPSKSAVVLTVDAYCDPAYAGVFGVGLTAVNEYPEWCVRIVDVPSSMPADVVEEVLGVVMMHPSAFDPVTVYADDGDGFSPRVLRWLSIDRVLPEERALSPKNPFHYVCVDRSEKRLVRNEEDGSIEERERIPAGQIAAEYRQFPLASLVGDEVVVSVRAASLNFKDVLIATQHIEDVEIVLGTDFAGVVADIGPSVTRFSIGDEVFGLGKHCFGNFLLGREVHMAKKPACLSFEEASAIPTTFLTAYFCLIKKADIKRGECVLVHSCSGGLGQAATQLAQWRGAEVIGTVGSDTKRDYMRRKYGVVHFGNSHAATWHEELQDSCGAAGDQFVDVVLNSLKGDNIERGMRMLRFGGRFVEVGKVDSLMNTQVGLRPFLRNIGLLSFHLDELGFHASAESRLNRALNHLAVLFKKGALSPTVEHVFAADEIADAIRLIQLQGHLGKVVVRFSPSEVPRSVLPSPQLFSPRKTYVISGGLGAVGFKMALWLVQTGGARNVVLLSRSGRSTKYQRRRLVELNARRGVRVHVARCDVTDAAAVDAMYEGLHRDRFPAIGGVFHLAMVLRDQKIAGMSAEDFDVVFRTKAVGAVNLVSPFSPDDLDFVVLFSSISTALCNPDQSNYVAGNFFCETYARQLWKKGYRAHVINVGAVKDAGLIAEDVLVRKIMRQKKVMSDAVTSKQVFAAVEQMLIGDPHLVQHCPVFGFAGVVSTFPNLKPFFSHLTEFKDEDRTSQDGADVALSYDTLNAVIKKLLLLEEDIDADERLTNYGVDSLQSVELASILEEEFGYSGVDQMDILSGITINQLLELKGLVKE